MHTTDTLPASQTPPDRDALIHRIGMLIVTDPVLDATHWDGYALIVRYDEAGTPSQRLSGFGYLDGGGFHAATPGNPELSAALDALREAMRTDERAPWDACVVQIRRDTRRVHVDFEYDAPQRWDITPATLEEVAERARPVS